MGTRVGGPSEAAITLLADGRTLLAVYRVQSYEYLWQSTSTDGGRTWAAAVQSNAWSVFPGLKTLGNGATILVSGRPGLGLWSLEDAASGRWAFFNLAAEHNGACGPKDGCGANSTYDAFTAGIVNASATVIDGVTYPIPLGRDRDQATPMMSKAYLGLEELGDCEVRSEVRRDREGDREGGREGGGRVSSSCDVLVLYDRDCNGGEGPDCPMCKYQRVHGDEDRVYAMRVTVTVSS